MHVLFFCRTPPPIAAEWYFKSLTAAHVLWHATVPAPFTQFYMRREYLARGGDPWGLRCCDKPTGDIETDLQSLRPNYESLSLLRWWTPRVKDLTEARAPLPPRLIIRMGGDRESNGAGYISRHEAAHHRGS
jgi:hypothetical protein